jgi:hypothetical protein
MNTFKKPDLNAPRFRPKKKNFLNKEYYQKFISENPKYSSLTIKDFKKIIKGFNQKIWETVIQERDGVELPEQLGFLFIGTCPRKIKPNIDFKKSYEYGTLIQNKNWESDDYLAKIFYTNFETKYRFKHHDMWGFSGVRDFKRTVAKTYPLEWKKYVMVDNLIKISRLFRIEKEKHVLVDETEKLLEEYDEFNLE